jgi:hypothetical protein
MGRKTRNSSAAVTPATTQKMVSSMTTTQQSLAIAPSFKTLVFRDILVPRNIEAQKTRLPPETSGSRFVKSNFEPVTREL